MWIACRLALVLSVGLWTGFGLALLVLGVAAVPHVLVLGILAFLFFRGRPLPAIGGWAFGTAWPETTGELLAGGHLREAGGLLLGKVPAPTVKEAARLLVRAPLSESEAVCRLFLAALTRGCVWLRLRGVTHAVAVCPTGAGKTTSIVITNALTDPTSMVITDPKGEVARATAAYRHREFGHRIVILDPWHVVTDRPDTMNPLDGVDPKSPRALDSLAALADDLVVRTGEEREPHWNDSALAFIWACVAWVLLRGKTGVRDLQTVATLLASPAELHTATAEMAKSKAWGGMMARLGGQLGHFAGEERGSALTTSNRHLRFLATPAVVESTTSSSFDPRQLRDERRPMTVYLVLPAEYQHSHAGLMRMWIGTLLRACMAGGANGRGRVRFVLDEAAALGRMQSVTDAISIGRGYSINLLFIYQSLGQLKLCFPEGQDQTFLSNMDAQVYFGPVNDLPTATAVSEMLGETTVAVAQHSGGSTTSKSRDAHGMESTSTTWNDGYSISETGRRLARPEEVMTLDERTAVIFSRTTRPIIARLVRYYEREFRDAPGRRPSRRGGAAWRCLVLAAVTFALAALLAVAVDRRTARKPAPVPQPAWPVPNTQRTNRPW